MKAYKGFNADMTCRGFQYKEGETYHEDIADLCHKGFHACERPLDVLEYYSPNSSVYHEVELDDVSEQREEDSKVCAKFIKIGAKVDITTLVEATVDYTVSKCDPVKSQHAKKNRGAASATGWNGAASATGDKGAASAIGDKGAASATGDWSVASATGFQGVASATGDWSVASANNPTAIAVAWGPFGRAKGVLGAHIVFAEWRNGKLVDAKMAVVDGNKIKADTYYMLKNGEFAEVKQ